MDVLMALSSSPQCCGDVDSTVWPVLYDVTAGGRQRYEAVTSHLKLVAQFIKTINKLKNRLIIPRGEPCWD